MNEKTIHLIANSHIDPVWLWNRSSGRSSWGNTMHSVVRIMKKYPEMKYSCSSSALYRWIEETDRRLFQDIKALIQEKRWEIVGGWEVQSDTILSRTEPLLRQGIVGKAYFQDRFGIDVKTAYCVDSFGHSAGLPKILRAGGLEHYVYTRGQEAPGLFRWLADDGSSVTALKVLESYGTASFFSRKEILEKLRKHFETPLEHQTLFFGVGDHGGAFSETQLLWLLEARSEYRIVCSTLEEYFHAVQHQVLPVVEGELGPVMRGCYSACHTVKHQIADTLERMRKAEALGAEEEELAGAWGELLFAHFHDSLPGTSIREAFERDIYPGLGFAAHTANEIIDRILCRRSAEQDTRFLSEGGIQVWNLHPFAVSGIVSFDGFTDPNNTGADFNALRSRDGRLFPLQMLPPVTSYGPFGSPWGRFTAVLPSSPYGEEYYAYERTAERFPFLGFRKQYALAEKLSFGVFPDHSGTWGSALFGFQEAEGFPERRSVQERVDGPACSVLRLRYEWRNSDITMDLAAYAGIPEIQIRLRINWHETRCCLKLRLDHGFSAADFFTGQSASILRRSRDLPSGTEEWTDGRKHPVSPPSGEFSMVDWCAVFEGSSCAGFYAADLHACDHAEKSLRMTLLRSVRYADIVRFAPDEESGWMDQGNIALELWYFESDSRKPAEIPQCADARLNPVEVREVTPHSGSGQAACPHPAPTLPEKHLVMSGLRRRKDGSWTCHITNYGEDTVWTSGERAFSLPGKSLTRCSFPPDEESSFPLPSTGSFSDRREESVSKRPQAVRASTPDAPCP